MIFEEQSQKKDIDSNLIKMFQSIRVTGVKDVHVKMLLKSDFRFSTEICKLHSFEIIVAY